MTLVGRSSALKALREGLHTGFVAVLGDAGIGKTALVSSALAGRPHYLGGALPSLRFRPGFPLERAIRTALGDDLDVAASVVRHHVGDSVLAVDDLQWADPFTIAVLDRLVGAVRVVLTARPDELDRESRTLIARAEAVHLAPLDRTSSSALLRRRHPDLPPERHGAVIEASNGNPLLLETLSDDDTGVTPTLVAAVRAQVDRMGADERDAVRSLALLERPASAAEVGTPTPATGLITRQGDAFAVRHALLAEAILAATPDAERLRLHRALASRLTGVEAARHLLAGGEPQQAVAVAERELRSPKPADVAAELRRVVATASAPLDPRRSRRWIEAAQALTDAGRYREAIEASLEVPVDDPLSAEASLQRARALWLAGDVPAARAAFDAALAGIRPEDDSTRALVLVERAYLEVRDRETGGLQLAQEAHRHAVGTGREVLRAEAVLGAAMLYEMQVGWDDLLRQVISEATRTGQDEIAYTAAHHLLSGLGFLGQRREAIDLSREMTSRAVDTGASSWAAHFQCSAMLNEASSSIRPDRLVEEASGFLDRHPLFRNRFQAETSLVFALLDLDRWDEARHHAEIHLRRAPDDQARVFALSTLAEVLWLAGDDEGVRRIADSARALGDVWWGTRVTSEVLAAHVAIERSLPYQPDVPAFVLPAMAPAATEVRALNKAANGDLVEAIHDLDGAAAAWREIGSWRWVIRAAGAGAGLADRAGLPDASRRDAAVVALATERGLRHHLRRFDRNRSERQLSDRQRQILRLVAEGLTSGQIAHRLGIASSTVDDHIENARRRLGAATRRSAAERTVPR